MGRLGVAHYRDDLIDRRRVSRVALTLVRRAPCRRESPAASPASGGGRQHRTTAQQRHGSLPWRAGVDRPALPPGEPIHRPRGPSSTVARTATRRRTIASWRSSSRPLPLGAWQRHSEPGPAARAEAVVAPPRTNRPGCARSRQGTELLNPDSEQAGSRSCVGRDPTDDRRDSITGLLLR